MIELQLSQGRVTVIDDCDSHLANYKWYFKDGYVARNVREDGKRRTVRLHREILNAPSGFDVDHVNGNRLDNRRRNLRLCSRAENMRNRGCQENCKSGFKGVYWEKGKWKADIKVNGKKIYLGRFTNQIDAALAYDDAARQYHGEFARTNFSQAA